MIARAVNAAAGVLTAAMTQGKQTPAGLAIALDAAGLLNSPEHAAEVDRMRTRLAEYERPADEDPIAFALTDKAEVGHPSYDELTDRQKTVAAPGTCGRALSTGKPCPDHPRPSREDVRPQVRKLRALLAGQRPRPGGAL